MATAPNRKERARERKDRRLRVDEATKIARLVLPEGQADRGGFAVADVANHSDSDQRHMVRSGEKRTVCRLTHIERLKRLNAITSEQALICEWYAKQHELGYQTVGCTANYSGAGGGGFGPSDLLARYKAQARARDNHIAARAAIPPALRHLFERVVLHGHGLAAAGGQTKPHSRVYSRLSISFRYACDCLREIFAFHND